MVEKAESQFLIIALVLCDKKKTHPKSTLPHFHTHTHTHLNKVTKQGQCQGNKAGK